MYATYNPFQAALSAAYHELTSKNAQRYYAIKAQKDIQNTLDTTITVFAWVYQIAESTYSLYVQSRTWSDSAYSSELSSELPLTDGNAIAFNSELKEEVTCEVIPDFWAEPLPCTDPTPAFTQSWNPPITYLPPQRTLLMLAPGAEPVATLAPKARQKAATANKPRATAKKANAQPKAKAKQAAGKTTTRRSPLKRP
ncbi:MAG TPA: hypothetical protein V6D19_20345 [Stenomitos sp.]